ncbi:MAG: DUF3798 domain-containing protein [Spirochaetales bacterium]|nr:DUF3798 domain-containing protein [Spirochaetales bacterium]
MRKKRAPGARTGLVIAMLALGLGAGLVAAFSSCAGTPAGPDAPKLVAMVSIVTDWHEATGPGAIRLAGGFGDAEAGGRVLRLELAEDDYGHGLPKGALGALAADTRIGAIVVAPALPGTVAAFEAIRKVRPELLLLAAQPWEHYSLYGPVADLVVDLDYLDRGWAIPWTAKALGADTFIHVSIARHRSMDHFGMQRDLMRLACRELGLEFVELDAPDPATEGGPQQVYSFVSSRAPLWIGKYGKQAAFYATNDAVAEPLMEAIRTYGGLFVETVKPSVRNAYPYVFMLDPALVADDYRGAFADLEKKAAANGSAGRFGVWSWSFGEATFEALGRAALAALDGGAELGADALLRALGESTPGTAWAVAPGYDFDARATAAKAFTARMDTWILGAGPSGSAGTRPPEALLGRVTGAR